MSRAIKTIKFSAIVVKNERGYVARPVELFLPNTYLNGSRPAPTQWEAINNLRQAVTQWLESHTDNVDLFHRLTELGFVGAIDSDKAEARIYANKEISLPLPTHWLRKEEGNPEQRENHAR